MTPPRAVLGVAPDADVETARRAYRRLVLECHPDRNPSPAAAARFAAIAEAYRTIVSEGRPEGRPGPPPAPSRAEPPVLSWRNVESNLHFCLRGLGRLVRKATTPKSDREP